MPMPTLGVSVYPEMRPLDEIATELARAARHGYTRVFSSMFSMPGSREEVLRRFGELVGMAHGVGMEVSLDVNPACMERLGATPDDLAVFAGIGADILRMDGAYGEDDNVAMLMNPHGLRIEYNASALDPGQVERLLVRGVSRERLLTCHNFYPQRYTGMAWQRFVDVNDRLSGLGLRIGAFVASHAPNTHGVWDATCGLPTVERLRDVPADLAARLMVAAGVTDVFFGNAYASDEELALVAEALAPVEAHFADERHREFVETALSFGGEGCSVAALAGRDRKVRVEPLYDLSATEREILFDFYPHVDMGDSSEWIWRTRMPRELYRDRVIEPRRSPLEEFPVGSVVMVNDRYRHYAGEVQVVLRPIRNDGTRNLVARIDEQEMAMFEFVRPGDPVTFLPVR